MSTSPQKVIPQQQFSPPEVTSNYLDTPSDWAIGLCDIGDCGSCCYVCCCPGMALSSALGNVDGGPFCFNLFCVSPCIKLWLIHNAYNIPFDWFEFCWKLYFCGNCYINQVYQTTTRRGYASMFRGKPHNQKNVTKCCPRCQCGEQLAACCCPCCYMSYQMKKHLSMPYCMSLCCGLYPWTAQHLLRYQYGYQGDEVCEECCAPALAIMFFPMSYPIVGIITATKTIQYVQAAQYEKITGRYLKDTYVAL